MSHWLLGDLLRGQLGFKGFVVSDNLDIYRLLSQHRIARSEAEAAKLALSAGVDMELDLTPGHTLSTYQHALVDLVRKGEVSQSLIDQSVARILEAKFSLGLFDRADTLQPASVLGNPRHRALALEAAQKAVVLLKNDGTLPLKRGGRSTIAIIGPHATTVQYGGYTGEGRAPGVTLLDGLRSAMPRATIVTTEGTSIAGGETGGIEDAARLAASADVVIMAIGESRETCGEGVDSDDLLLPGAQLQLFLRVTGGTKAPVVTVLTNCRPLVIPDVSERSNALIEAWYLGSETGNALASVLTGAYNPGGKLTVTFPRKVGQLPVFYQKKAPFAGLGRGKYYKSSDEPAYPLGFGLSYTSFSISAPVLDKGAIPVGGSAIASVTVTNSGNVAGDEVVQMYISPEYASVGHYEKLLKGFKRVRLVPGQSRTVQFTVGPEALTSLDRELKPIVEAGYYRVRIGNASNKLSDVRLRVGAPGSGEGPARSIRDQDDAVVAGGESSD